MKPAILDERDARAKDIFSNRVMYNALMETVEKHFLSPIGKYKKLRDKNVKCPNDTLRECQ